MKTVATTILVAVFSAAPALANVTVVLTDGRVLTAVELGREAGLFLLAQESGQVIPIPVSLVVAVEPAEAASVEPVPPPADAEPRVDPWTGLTYGRAAETLAGEREPAPAVISGGPQLLAGDPIRFPSRAELLAVLGEPSRFPRSVIDPNHTVSTDWDFSDPGRSNNWKPSRWSEGSFEPDSPLGSDWDPDPGRGNNWAPSRWPNAPFESSWIPEDGFSRTRR